MTRRKPEEVYEPSANGTRSELHCSEQIEATLRYLGIEKNPEGIEYLIVCCDDDGEVVEVWEVRENEWLATQVFRRAQVMA